MLNLDKKKMLASSGIGLKLWDLESLLPVKEYPIMGPRSGQLALINNFAVKSDSRLKSSSCLSGHHIKYQLIKIAFFRLPDRQRHRYGLDKPSQSRISNSA